MAEWKGRVSCIYISVSGSELITSAFVPALKYQADHEQGIVSEYGLAVHARTANLLT